MAGHDEGDDIFDDDEPLSDIQGQDKETVERDLNSKREDKKEEADINEFVAKTSHKKLMAIGGGLIASVAVLVVLALTGTIDVINESESFDASGCNFGIHQDFFGERCITLEEYEESTRPIVEEGEVLINPVPRDETGGSGGTKDVSSASDKVELEKTKDVIGYYMITSSGDWYGDFVDFRKIPSKVEETGSMKVNFRCYTDSFAGTSTYFATFRNVIDNNLTVEVYINSLEVESKTTNTNKALILEGSCYGHES